MIIGVLALQGDYEAHRKILESAPEVARVLDVRDVEALIQCDGLVIPGGESTTMSRLCDRYELWQPLQQKLHDGMGALGTCAGLIMLSHRLEGATKNFAQKTLDVLDVDVARNAYGAQLDSFECELEIAFRVSGIASETSKNDVTETGLSPIASTPIASTPNSPTPNSKPEAQSMRAVFIRAPRITRVGHHVEVLARHNGEAVAVRCENIVACAFHPEIAGESALHELWLRTLINRHTPSDLVETPAAEPTVGDAT